ncbi:hypothetical protein SUGI_0534210 [Cryptomeria japonica]|nr:hypothetical protein SUGI_0534210 [Cryptomeria japonica]
MWDSGQKLKRKKIEEKKDDEGEDKNDAEQENDEEEQDDDGKQEDCNRMEMNKKENNSCKIYVTKKMVQNIMGKKRMMKMEEEKQKMNKKIMIRKENNSRSKIKNPRRSVETQSVPKASFNKGKTALLPPKPLTMVSGSIRDPNSALVNVLEINENLVKRIQQSCKAFGVFARWRRLRISSEAIADWFMSSFKWIVSIAILLEGFLYIDCSNSRHKKEVLTGVTAELETPLVSMKDPHFASTDVKGGELDALPLPSNQAIRVEDCRNSNGSPHSKACSTNEERVVQDEDPTHKEEEVNFIINYLCDSVTEEIMNKMLDEIIDKEELVLQKNLLDKEIIAFSPPPVVSDIEELLLDLNNKVNETLGIELWEADKSILDCAKLFKKRDRKSLSELRANDGSTKG